MAKHAIESRRSERQEQIFEIVMNRMRSVEAETALSPDSSRWQRMLAMDQAMLMWVRGRERRWLTTWMLWATRLGDASTLILAGVLLLLLGEAYRPFFMLLVVSTAAGSGTAGLLKLMCRRERPQVQIDGFVSLVAMPDPHSFPSGHTATAFSIATAFTGQGLLLSIGLWLTALCIGSSRIYLGAHYPLDVFFGGLIGFTAGLIVRVILL